jgi:hypothetical protein
LSQVNAPQSPEQNLFATIVKQALIQIFIKMLTLNLFLLSTLKITLSIMIGLKISATSRARE